MVSAERAAATAAINAPTSMESAVKTEKVADVLRAFSAVSITSCFFAVTLAIT